MKLIIVDDNDHFRESLRFFLVNKLNHEVIGEASSGEEFILLNNVNEADIVLMDIEMKNLNGIGATKKIIDNHRKIKIIAVTMLIEDVFLEELIGAGFKGCVFKTDVFSRLGQALIEVHKGNLFFHGNIKMNDFL